MGPALASMAIVVGGHASSPPPPPPAQPGQSQCEYSVEVNPRVYRCYTADEYAQKLKDDEAAQQKSNQELQQAVVNFFLWCLGHWWQILLWTLGGIVALIAIAITADSIERKKHPERFDANGFRRDWYDLP